MRKEKRPGGKAGPKRQQPTKALLSTTKYKPDAPQRQPRTEQDECDEKLYYVAADSMFGVLQELAQDGLIQYGSPQVIDACIRNWEALCSATYLTPEEGNVLREAMDMPAKSGGE